MSKNFNRSDFTINRDCYLKELVNRKHNRLIKVITGMRRCGKSYLLNTIFYNHLIDSSTRKDHIIKFAFDSADDLNKIGEDLLDIGENNKKVDPKKFIAYINEQLIDSENYSFLLDEIQNLGSFESVLNGYLRKENLDVVIVGCQ